MRRLRVAPEAQRDIDGLLAFSEERFGKAAADRYRNLIDTALLDLRADPDRSGARAINAFGKDLRSLHLSTVRASAPPVSA
jgi:toxin ParE1/3/4